MHSNIGVQYQVIFAFEFFQNQVMSATIANISMALNEPQFNLLLLQRLRQIAKNI